MNAASFRQRVPRPLSYRRGPPPAWAALPLAQRSSVPIGRILAAVASASVAGETEMVAVAEAAAERRTDPLANVSAAVLVPVFGADPDAEATIVLIRRSTTLQRDPGHVAFPGGRVEPGEAPGEAALREAEEEIGLSPSDVEAYGLVDLVGRPSGEQIAAYLGVLGGPPTLAPNASEVESVLQVPVAALLADGVAWQERWSSGAGERSVHFFAHPGVLGDDLVWGVSAGILWRLLEQVVGTP